MKSRKSLPPHERLESISFTKHPKLRPFSSSSSKFFDEPSGVRYSTNPAREGCFNGTGIGMHVSNGGLTMTDNKETNASADAIIKTEETEEIDEGSAAVAAAAATTDDAFDKERMTCDVLCSLSSMVPSQHQAFEKDSSSFSDNNSETKKRANGKSCSKSCPKQLQLPMFLSKTYHMIDKCDPEIAAWGEGGDSFVVKSVEKFALHVLPLYFKHSNFSSFARQLNFYGFRKLRTDPILNDAVDPRTACYVRFYHEKFQKDKPELLHHIKRATKSEQHSKDDVDSLKEEVARLRETQAQMKDDFDRRLAELSYECNRRVTSLSADYDKLCALVQPLLRSAVGAPDATATAVAALRDMPTRTQMPDLLHSLSHAAVSLQNHLRSQQQQHQGTNGLSGKRSGEDMSGGPSSSRPRYS